MNEIYSNGLYYFVDNNESITLSVRIIKNFNFNFLYPVNKRGRSKNVKNIFSSNLTRLGKSQKTTFCYQLIHI